MNRRRTLLLLPALLLEAACENADQPLTPAWGKQRCGHCSMVVGERRFAGQAVATTNERLFFDDPGCLATYVLAHQHVRHAWVLSDGRWVEARAARFTAGAKSPMDYGFEARGDGQLGWDAVLGAARAVSARGAGS